MQMDTELKVFQQQTHLEQIGIMNIQNNIFELLKFFRSWSHLSGFPRRRIVNSTLHLPTFPDVVEYVLKTDKSASIAGKSIFFFSDLHYDGNQELSSISTIVDRVSPDWIVFGGDLITYSCHFEGAFEWLEKTFADFADIPKLAVPGNWDRRRRAWFPQKLWYEMYSRCGFTYLVNEGIEIDGVYFYGTDDPRSGFPRLSLASLSPNRLNCIISHNPESVVAMGEAVDISSIALCGHTHGGQIRIPFFGAVMTSNKYWKLLEYGHYRQGNAGTELLISSGLGKSRLPVRLFCPPEVLVVRFI